MDDATERRTAAEDLLPELADITIAIGKTGRHAILGLRRNGGDQVEEFRITTERLRSVCRPFLEKVDSSFPDPTVVELRKIREKLSEIGEHMPLSAEVAAQVVDLLHKVYVLPKLERK